MKNWAILCAITACIALAGCDDSNNSNMQCALDCVHGTCYTHNTSEQCNCDHGYLTDANGACTVPQPPKIEVSAISTNGQDAQFDVQVIDEAKITEGLEIVIARDGQEILKFSGRDKRSVSDPFGSNKKAHYTISAKTTNGIEVDPVYLPIWNESTAWDWRNAVMYFTFIDRFVNGNPANDNPLNSSDKLVDWMGGDFAGLKEKVESGYFADLGVNTLWISSVSMNTQKAVGNASAYHSYWPITTGYTDETASMFEGYTSNGVAITPIEPHFGTMQELHELVETCHNHGMRVLVDFAVNHVDSDSPVYIQHPEWFNYGDYKTESQLDSIQCEGPNKSGTNWDSIPEKCWFGTNLPDFNYELPEVRKFVIDHAKWLIRTTGIDGFRLDAVKHMPIELIKELRAGIDELMAPSGQTFYMVGETFDGDKGKIKKYISDSLLHGQFDFPLYFQIRATLLRSIDDGGSEYWRLKDFVKDNDTAYDNMCSALPEKRAILSTFLGNHDVERAISYTHYDPDNKVTTNPEVTDDWAYHRLRVAWTFLLTSPMVPLIYYGDEFGLEGSNDPDNRRMMKFGDSLNPEQKKTLEHVQKLGQIRREHPVLATGKRKTINAKERSYMYLMQNDDETILVGISDLGNGYCEEVEPYIVPEGANGWEDLLDPSNTISETTSIVFCGYQTYVWKAKK